MRVGCERTAHAETGLDRLSDDLRGARIDRFVEGHDDRIEIGHEPAERSECRRQLCGDRRGIAFGEAECLTRDDTGTDERDGRTVRVYVVARNEPSRLVCHLRLEPRGGGLGVGDQRHVTQAHVVEGVAEQRDGRRRPVGGVGGHDGVVRIADHRPGVGDEAFHCCCDEVFGTGQGAVVGTDPVGAAQPIDEVGERAGVAIDDMVFAQRGGAVGVQMHRGAPLDGVRVRPSGGGGSDGNRRHGGADPQAYAYGHAEVPPFW